MNEPRTQEAIREELNFHIDALENLLGETELNLSKEGMERAGDCIHYLRQAASVA